MRNIETRRYIRLNNVERLDSLPNVGSGTSHSHPNKDFLDNLNIDENNRLTYEDQVLPLPVIEDNW